LLWKKWSGQAQAQVIAIGFVDSTKEPGKVTVTASAPGLSPYVLKWQTDPLALRISEQSYLRSALEVKIVGMNHLTKEIAPEMSIRETLKGRIM
jgi:hypothetical protein